MSLTVFRCHFFLFVRGQSTPGEQNTLQLFAFVCMVYVHQDTHTHSDTACTSSMYTIVPEAEVNTGEYSLVYKPRRSRGLYN